MTRNIKKLFLGFTAIALAFGISAVAYGATNVNKSVRLGMGKAETVTLSGPVADVLVANPAMADVGTLRNDRLYIVGKGVGDTNVLAFDADGNQLANIAVHVSRDESSVRESIKQFFPKEKIEVHTVNDNIILKGRVSTPSVANQVRDLAGRLVNASAAAAGQTSTQTVVDLMTVDGEQQVMLQVKVMEAKRTVLREFGFEMDYKDITSTTNAAVNTVAGTGLTALAPFAAGQIFFDDNNKFGPLKVGLQALERDGLVNTLAEPTLTAISGETAGFLAGGEFPVPTGRDQDGNITLEFKQFGVSLNFSPTVLSNDRISLQLSTEVSAKSDADSVTLINTVIPGLTVRRAQTTIQMGSGGTLMIAGLIKSDTLDSLNGLPGAKDLPIIGELFKSKSFQRNESELVIMVTPYIVEPFAQPNAQRVASENNPQPRPIMDNVPTEVPAVNGIGAPKMVIPPGDEGKGNYGDERTHKMGKRASLEPRSFPRFGEEDRTAGGSRIASVDKRKQGNTQTATELAAVAPAAGNDPLQQALQEVDAANGVTVTGKVATVDLLRPMKKPGQAEHALAFQQKREAGKAEQDMALNNPGFIEPVLSQPITVGGVEPPAPLKAVAKTAATTLAMGNVVDLPRPLRKPGQKHTGVQKAAIDAKTGTSATDAKGEKSASTLSNTFMKNLGKVYGKKVPSTMGETNHYGYIVD
jgi:pilus assembly protein CpaC